MPKRRNPFGDCSPLQFKTHVGQRELNCGVTGVEKMKSVYERTKQLLFQGAQRSTSPIVTDVNDNTLMDVNISESVPESSTVQPTPGQLRLDHCGQLTAPFPNGDLQMDAAGSENKSSMRKKDTLDRSICNFCEKISDTSSIQQCCSCNGDFCQLCSVVNYDECTERIFCLNCNS